MCVYVCVCLESFQMKHHCVQAKKKKMNKKTRDFYVINHRFALLQACQV